MFRIVILYIVFCFARLCQVMSCYVALLFSDVRFCWFLVCYVM